MEIIEPIAPKEMGALLDGSNEKIEVPAYQRRFSWKEEHFEDLWNDLDSLDGGEKHFFGTIVFMSDTHVQGETHKLEVVDGQQRITTISILLCSLRDFLKDNYKQTETEDRIENINESLWLVDRDGNREGMRVKLGNLDEESYSNLIKSNFDDIENKNILEAYYYFHDKLKELGDLSEIKSLHDKILDQLIYVSITAEGHTDAYHLFEAMNNRGLTLSPIDLMKNYLLMRACEREDISEDEEERIEELWGKIIKNLDQITDVNKPAITFFRQYFMSSKLLDINKKITKSKLYEPTFIEKIDETSNVVGLLEDIKKQSELYRNLLTQNIDMFDKSENVGINRLLKDAKTVSITSFTLLLRAFKELKDPKKLKKVIKKANALLIRRQICGKNTGPHDAFFNHLAQNAFDFSSPLDYIDNYLYSEERFPNDEQFKRFFASENFSRSDRTKYVLSKIEERGFRNQGMEVPEDRYKVHIEHILPRVYGKNLQKLWLDRFNISKDEHEDYKKKIGNLTLLERDPNIYAGNRTLEEKQKYYTEEETEYKMTHPLTEYEKWNVEKIKERGEKLAEMAIEIWSL